MAQIDIRIEGDGEITEIVFASEDDCYDSATSVVQGGKGSSGIILLDCRNGDPAVVMKKDIKNLIKALQKAEEIWGNK